MNTHVSVAAPVTLVDEAFLQRAQELLAIRSTHDRPDELRRALNLAAAPLLVADNVTVEYFEKNGSHSLLAYFGSKRPERFKVLLNGHVDVVAGRDEQFEPYVEGNRLYGRGALDMKVAALILVEAFLKVGATVDYPLGLQLVTDEETGGFNGAKHQFEQGVTGDFFMTGEQSNGDVAVMAKGVGRIRVRRKGVASHSAYLWRGDNALLRLMEFVRKLHQLYPVPTQEAWVSTVSVAQMRALGDGAFNRVPDAAEVDLDFRFIPGEKHFESQESLVQLLKSLDPEVEAEIFCFEPAMSAEPDHPLIMQLQRITSEVWGKESKTIRRHGGSDARHLLADPLMRAVEYGLGGGNDHGEGEYVELATAAAMRRALPQFLQSLKR